MFPSPVNTFTIDPAERAIFVGTSTSDIHQYNLIKSNGGRYEAVGGDPSHPLTVESAQNDFRGHAAPVTAINLSFDGSILVSGDQSGELFIWDIGSRQVLRIIKKQKGRIFHAISDIGPITSVITFLKPTDIVVSETQQFKRLQNERGRNDHDIWITIPKHRILEMTNDPETVKSGLQELRDEGSESKLKSRVIELEDELKRAYGAYGELRGIHENLWKKFVDQNMPKEEV